MAGNVRSGNGGRDDAGDAGKRRAAIRAAAQRPDLTPRSGILAEAAPVFVSYSRTDMSVVGQMIDRLRRRGGTVTWDQDFIAGSDFEQAICKAIDVSRSVIVVWSPASVQSPYVRDEARRALMANKLITTHVAGFNVADVPLGFGHLHTVPVDNHVQVRKSLAQYGVVLRT